jgi:hypothetical protein
MVKIPRVINKLHCFSICFCNYFHEGDFWLWVFPWLEDPFGLKLLKQCKFHRSLTKNLVPCEPWSCHFILFLDKTIGWTNLWKSQVFHGSMFKCILRFASLLHLMRSLLNKILTSKYPWHVHMALNNNLKTNLYNKNNVIMITA